MQPTLDPSTTTTLSDLDSYMSYAPTPRTSSKSHQSQSEYFEKLGFKLDDESKDKRHAFLVNMKDHVRHRSHRFLQRRANPEAFQNVVSEFLTEYGPVYWGDSKRDHLQEPNSLKGFLYPRDAKRANSRLVPVLESFFNHKASKARYNDTRKPEANRSNRDINFAALTGRKADLTPPFRVTELATHERHPSKRRRVLSESKEPTQPIQTQDNDQTGTVGKTALPIGLDSYQSTLPGPSQDPTSTLNPLPGAIWSDLSPILITDDSDTDEKQQRQNANTQGPSKVTTGPDSSTQDKHAHVKDEPLSPGIISRIELRVKADGPGVSARGPIPVEFEVYKTSERLFTSLMSERNLKPEMQKRVAQLTATIGGKEMCCRRDRLNDWAKVCRELRELWDHSPELFDKRFEVDIMLHVDE